MNLAEVFEEREDIQVLQDEPLSKHVNFRIGGPADWYVIVKSVAAIKDVLAACKEADLPWFVLGGGSNTLVSDEGFRGVVIQPAMRNIEIDGNMVIAEAGALSVAVARQTANAGLAGMVWAISLPGTIGGAVRGNAGCFGGEMKDSVKKVEVLRDGEVIELGNEDLRFGYRESSVKHSKDIVLRVFMELEPGSAEELKQQLIDIVTQRKEKQPLYAGSAGCMFKNYEVKSAEEMDKISEKVDVPEAMKKSGTISTGWIIDQMDLKGFRIGDASISEEHGNFLINHGKATADEIAQLIAVVKTRVRNNLGVQLEEEVQYLGF